MFKSVQGHQHLCAILRKALLHRNPRQEGVGFERKINPDGTYWAPEQYPKTVWVLAKEKPIDIANLSGFSCKIDKAIVDESLDSYYKLTKDQAGKVSAEYIGTPPENGFYKRQIWVRKSLVEKLPANHSMQGKPTVPPRHFYSLEERNDPLVPKLIFLRKNIIVLTVLLIAIAITMIRLLFPIVMLTPRRRFMCMVCLMVPLTRIILLAKRTLHLLVHLLLLRHLLVCGWLR